MATGTPVRILRNELTLLLRRIHAAKGSLETIINKQLAPFAETEAAVREARAVITVLNESERHLAAFKQLLEKQV